MSNQIQPSKYLASNMLPTGPEIIRARGIRVYDGDGNEYFDLTSQTLNLNLGHGHPYIMDALRNHLNEEGHYYVSQWFRNRHVNNLAEKLVSIAPDGLTKVNLQMCNGSDANEDAFKRARKHKNTKRRGMIVSLNGSHLGVSSETISASGEHFGKEVYLGGSGDYIFIDPCYTFRRPKGMSVQEYSENKVKEFENLVKRRGDVAGIIIELLPFDAGILVQPKEYVKGIERICMENDVAMIVDEVQTAFGWCGTMFLSEQYDIQPDIMTLAKGLTAGFPALAATLFKEKYDVLEPGTSEYTFGAQPIGCVAALANIDYLMSSGVMNTVSQKHDRFMDKIRRMQQKYSAIGDIRGIGLIFGIEFVHANGEPDMDIGMEVYKASSQQGLLVNIPMRDEGKDNVISLKPPIIITEEEIDETMRRFDNAMQSCLS